MRKQVSFDSIARPYRWLEYLSFGLLLERSRFHFLSKLEGCRKALVLGDGDGRFTARLMRSNPTVIVDAVDSSSVMLALLVARGRQLGPEAVARLTTHCVDALQFASNSGGYDLIATHFFLDCLSEADVTRLVERLTPWLAPNAIWIVSEFAVPSQPMLAACAGRMLLDALYRIFGVLTGLRTRRLPAYREIFLLNGARCSARQSRLWGLLVSELWEWTGKATAKRAIASQFRGNL